MKSIRRVFASIAIVLASAAGGLALNASPAHAIYGQVYIVTPKWWGWCPGTGNYVTQVVAHNITTGDRAASLPGKDVAFLRIDFERSNKVVVAVSCKWNTPLGATATIRPVRHKQTFYFGYPSGTYTSG